MTLKELKERKAIKLDRMAYTKDKVPSWLALLAILFNVFFFVSIYKTNLSAYYNYIIGLSVLSSPPKKSPHASN